jgi:hypothetical protein
VAFGGTGKTVALIYAHLCRITGYHPNIVIVDFPPGQDPNATDGRLDEDLAALTDATVRRISTLPDQMPLQFSTLKDVFSLDDAVADALFTPEQQRTPPLLGLNAEPQVGACVAQLKLTRDRDTVRSALLTNDREIFFVAGLGGGTGAGVSHHFARFVAEAPVPRRGVFLLPWRDIGADGTVTNAQQMRNAASVLAYLKHHGNDIYTDTVVIGGLPGLELYSGDGAEGHKAKHPTLILAALYLLLEESWGGSSHLTMQRRRLETPAGGIRLHDIQTPVKGKSLHDMLVLSKRRIRVFRDLANENPDQVLTWFSLAPLSQPLACMVLCWVLKAYARRSSHSDYSRAWDVLRSDMLRISKDEEDRIEWVTRLVSQDKVSQHKVFDFDMDELNRDAEVNYKRYLARVRSSREYTRLRNDGQNEAEALSRATAFLWDLTTGILLGD